VEVAEDLTHLDLQAVQVLQEVVQQEIRVHKVMAVGVPVAVAVKPLVGHRQDVVAMERLAL